MGISAKNKIKQADSLPAQAPGENPGVLLLEHVLLVLQIHWLDRTAERPVSMTVVNIVAVKSSRLLEFQHVVI